MNHNRFFLGILYFHLNGIRPHGLAAAAIPGTDARGKAAKATKMGVRTETLDINLTDMRRPFSCQPKFTLYGCSKPVNIGMENEIFPLTYCIFSTKKIITEKPLRAAQTRAQLGRILSGGAAQWLRCHPTRAAGHSTFGIS
jgi:hypothetical protein